MWYDVVRTSSLNGIRPINMSIRSKITTIILVASIAPLISLAVLVFSEYPETRSLENQFLIFVALAFLFVVFLTSILSQFITEPLRALMRTLEKFHKGDFSVRAGVYTKDEVGQLAETFNQMAQGLEVRYGELEQKVKDRTAELKEANEKLSAFDERIKASDKHMQETNVRLQLTNEELQSELAEERQKTKPKAEVKK